MPEHVLVSPGNKQTDTFALTMELSKLKKFFALHPVQHMFAADVAVAIYVLLQKNDQGHAVKLVLLAVLRLFMVLRLRSTHASALLLLVSCQCCWDVKLLVCNGCM
jgi:hypothetical protein